MASVIEEELLEDYRSSRRLVELIEEELERLLCGLMRERKIYGMPYFDLQFREGRRAIR